MNFKHIKSLVTVDLLSSMRQMANGTQKSKITKKNVYRRVLLTNVMMMVLLPFMFSTFLINFPLNQMPGTTTYLIFSVLGMAFFQLFIVTYNLMFQEQEFSNYLALPFTKLEFLLSKVCTALISSAGFMVPVGVFIAIFAYKSNVSLVWGILFGLFSFALLTVVMMEVIILLLSALTQFKWFRRYEKYIMLFFNILMIAVIFYISFSSTSSNVENALEGNVALLDRQPIVPLLPFIQVFTKDWVKGWLGVAIWVLAGILLYVWIERRVVPKMFSEKAPLEKVPAKKRKKQAGRTVYPELKSILRSYQMKLMEDTTLLLMMLFSKVYFPLIFFIPMFMNAGDSMAAIPVGNTWGAYILVGMVGAYLTMGPASLAAVGISLEKENLYYIKTLPFNFPAYIRNKFRTAFLVEWVAGLLVYMIPAFFAKISPWIILAFAVGYTVATYLLSAYYFKRDWRLLSLNWSNVNELFSRGGNRVVQTFGSLFLMFLMIGVVAAITVGMYAIGPTWQLIASVGIAVLVLLSAFWMYRSLQKNFWPIFDGKLEGYEELMDVSDRGAGMSSKEQKEHFGWFSFPGRRLHWKDYVWMFLSTNLFLQIVVTNVYAIFNWDMIQQAQGVALEKIYQLTAWSTIASLPVMLLVIYWRKIPLFNRKRLTREESQLIPGLTTKDWKFLFIYIPVSYMIYNAGSLALNSYFGENNPINQQGIEQIAGEIPLWVLFLMIVVVAPIVEELFFRGMIMFSKPHKEPGWGVTLLSALIFGLIHTPTDIQSFYTYVGMGLLFSYGAKKTNSVEAGMIYHFLNNLIGFLAIAYAAS